MLGWGLPAAFWFGLTLLPIAFFYFLRMRFPQHPVSSIYLWSKVNNLTRGGSKLRQRSIFLLMLQLLAALAAVVSLTQPFWYSRIFNRPGVIYMLDISASMAATDVSKTNSGAEAPYNDRLTQAKALLKKEVLKLPTQTTGMIFLCSNGARPLGTPTANRNKLLKMINHVKVSSSGFDEAAVAEDMQAWLAIHKGIWKACLITDGGLDLGGKKLITVFGSALRSIPVGINGNNIGLTALRLGAGQAEFSVSNGWPVEKTIEVSLYKGDKVIAQNSFKVPTGVSSQRIAFSYKIQPDVYRIQLERQSGVADGSILADAFAGDDQYYLAVNQPRPIKVLLAGGDNPFLQAILSQPEIHLVETPKLPPGFNGEGWDLIIVEQTGIPKDLRCNLLSFQSMPPDAPLQFDKPVTGVLQGYESSINHSLLRFVDWQSVRINSDLSLKVKDGRNSDVAILAKVEENPVLVAWEKDGWHNIVSSFNLYQSDLGLSGAFPIFIQNLIQWCVPQYNNPLAYTLTVGETVTLAEPPSWQIINADSTKTYRNGAQLTVSAETPGIFAWGRGVTRGVLVANLPARELDIAPQPLHIGKTSQQLSVGNSIQRLPLTDWALILFLLCLCGEWILWRGLPGRKGVIAGVVD
jgi:Ca-activated chloride channel family protein